MLKASWMINAYLPAYMERSGNVKPIETSQLINACRKILVVDDDDNIRKMTTILLEDSGYSVMSAANGEEGLKQFLQHKDVIQLVVTDIMMPNMNGFELSRNIKWESPTLPIILVSGYAASSFEAERDILSQCAYCQKPYESDLLLDKLSNLILSK